MNRIGVAFLPLALVLVAGCGGGDGGAPRADSPSSVAKPSSTPPSAATPTSRPTAVAHTPAGWRLTTAKKAGLRFAMPRTWTRFDASKLKDPALRPRMEQFAKGLGVTPDQLQQVFKQIDVMAVSASAGRNSYGEVEVTPVPLLAELPTHEAIRAQLGVLHGIRIVGIRDVLTPVGKGLGVSLRKHMAGIGSAASAAVFVLLDSGVVSVSVTAATAQRASLLLKEMTASFSDVGRGGSVGHGSAVTG